MSSEHRLPVQLLPRHHGRHSPVTSVASAEGPLPGERVASAVLPLAGGHRQGGAGRAPRLLPRLRVAADGRVRKGAAAGQARRPGGARQGASGGK